MKHLTHTLVALIWHFGGLGLLVLGILDSSFLFAPLGNDLLVVAMSASEHSVPRMLYYAGMSTIGSILGCLLIDVIFRKAGEKGLESHRPARRIEYVKRKMEKSGVWALAIASVAPPPFPFTPFVMAAAALQYPRRRMLIVTGFARMLRFTVLGALALIYGKSILRWAENSIVQWLLAGLIVVCVVGSAISVWRWVKRSRNARGSSPPQPSSEPARPALR